MQVYIFNVNLHFKCNQCILILHLNVLSFCFCKSKPCTFGRKHSFSGVFEKTSVYNKEYGNADQTLLHTLKSNSLLWFLTWVCTRNARWLHIWVQFWQQSQKNTVLRLQQLGTSEQKSCSKMHNAGRLLNSQTCYNFLRASRRVTMPET